MCGAHDVVDRPTGRPRDGRAAVVLLIAEAMMGRASSRNGRHCGCEADGRLLEARRWSVGGGLRNDNWRRLTRPSHPGVVESRRDSHHYPDNRQGLEPSAGATPLCRRGHRQEAWSCGGAKGHRIYGATKRLIHHPLRNSPRRRARHIARLVLPMFRHVIPRCREPRGSTVPPQPTRHEPPSDYATRCDSRWSRRALRISSEAEAEGGPGTALRTST